MTIRDLKQRRFWARHVNRKWGLLPFYMPCANKLVLLSFFSLLKTIYPRVSTKALPNDAKSPLPVDVRRSKTLLLNHGLQRRMGLLWHRSRSRKRLTKRVFFSKKHGSCFHLRFTCCVERIGLFSLALVVDIDIAVSWLLGEVNRNNTQENTVIIRARDTNWGSNIAQMVEYFRNSAAKIRLSEV